VIQAFFLFQPVCQVLILYVNPADESLRIKGKVSAVFDDNLTFLFLITRSTEKYGLQAVAAHVFICEADGSDLILYREKQPKGIAAPLKGYRLCLMAFALMAASGKIIVDQEALSLQAVYIRCTQVCGKFPVSLPQMKQSRRTGADGFAVRMRRTKARDRILSSCPPLSAAKWQRQLFSPGICAIIFLLQAESSQTEIENIKEYRQLLFKRFSDLLRCLFLGIVCNAETAERNPDNCD
jgi:hypothetical protein